jgi:hypothetical protein
MSTLDPRSEAALERWLAQAPPLSERQRDLIAAACSCALTDAAGPGE